MTGPALFAAPIGAALPPDTAALFAGGARYFALAGRFAPARPHAACFAPLRPVIVTPLE